ncbi:DNA polymerase Y family protein [Asticcacaulis sp.]|uniref:Y-family DNA polymerase n=1 Tax=Asticcacaulis sp. TaxID=1872648 RepID=UPI002605277C|nr:DNA polymerase Y family protein [Asticcacaulis sp.]
MARCLSLYLPFWGTDRLRRAVGLDALPLERALVLQGKVGSRRLVTAVDALAHQRGVRPGMAVAKAQVLIEGLEVRDAEIERDAEALETLAVWALRLYSPVVAADPPDGLILDITGAAHLYGGEAALVSDILRRLEALHITAYAAVADSWGAAHALVRFAGKSSLIIAQGKSTEAILPLPVAALRLPAETVEELRLIGIDTIGELAAKPRAPLALRYGPDLWRRVDMAFGRLAEPIEPVHVPELISVERAFFEPIGAPDTLEKYIRAPQQRLAAIGLRLGGCLRGPARSRPGLSGCGCRNRSGPPHRRGTPGDLCGRRRPTLRVALPSDGRLYAPGGSGREYARHSGA